MIWTGIRTTERAVSRARFWRRLTAFSFILIASGADALAQNSTVNPSYIGSDTCIACHKDQGAAWQGSHHALAWTTPNDGAVLGNFDAAVFEHLDVTHRFSRDGDAYVMETEGPDGEMNAYEVVGVAGIAPLQQYLFETERGRLQSHDVAWDTEREEWFHLYPDQRQESGDGLHWTGPYKTWNARCAECHATGYEKRFDPASRRYDSRQAEIGVGCEACHGPGSLHRYWAEAGAPADGDRGLTARFPADDPEAQIQQCAGCHSRREPFESGNPTPGRAFHDAYRLALLRPGLYHSDGAILGEVYVYGSFLQSKMYANGVRCTDCHDPHRAELKADGNAVCTQCHSPSGNTRFPSLRTALYDGPEHHFHPAENEGAACVNCHMVDRTYMQVDPRRDHSFRIPRPDLSDETGAPNACTDCHADRDSAWAAAELIKQFPTSPYRGPHFSKVFSTAALDPSQAADALLDIAEDVGEAGIVRASALELAMPATNPDRAARAATLISDPDPLVRAGAVAMQRGAPPGQRAALVPALTDPMRSVRIAAVREFLNAPVNRAPDAAAQAARAAMSEWNAALYAKADFPETQLVLGGMALTAREWRAAERSFEEAVSLDPQIARAWAMIVRIREALGDTAGALAALEKALEANPADKSLAALQSEIPSVK